MAWNTAGVLGAVAAILTAIPGMGQVYTGVPESIGRRVVAVVAVGGQRLEFDAFRIQARDVGIYVEFAYRVSADADIAAAEDQLAGFLDRFLDALYADQTLGGTCEWIETDFSLTNDPNYRPTAGLEFRVFPVQIWARQTNAA